MTDRELLHQLARNCSEDAFNEIVRRHVDLVHSAALRQLGNSDTARDITQNVLILLAKQAKQLKPDVILTGWLYRTTRNLCLEHIRKDQRRRDREQAAADHLMNTTTADQWELVAPELEPAMDELNEGERHAVLLRFFNNKSLRDVGNELGIGEDAAQKRVSRALDRLRAIFSKRGVTLSATALATTISGSAVQAAPAAVITTIATAALGAGLTAAVTSATLNATTTMTTLYNLKTAAAVIAAVAVTGGSTYLVKEKEVDRLRADYETSNETRDQLANELQQAVATIHLRDQQIVQLKLDIEDVHRLRGEVDRLNRDVTAMAALKSENADLKQRLTTALHAAQITPAPKPTAVSVTGPSQVNEEFLVRYGLWNEQTMKETRMKRLNSFRILGLAMIMFADDNQGQFPQGIDVLHPYLNGDRNVGGERIKLLFSGAVQDIQNPSKTIIARQEHTSTTPDSDRIWRVYTFADGHSEIKESANIDELTVWENQRVVTTR